MQIRFLHPVYCARSAGRRELFFCCAERFFFFNPFAMLGIRLKQCLIRRATIDNEKNPGPTGAWRRAVAAAVERINGLCVVRNVKKKRAHRKCTSLHFRQDLLKRSMYVTGEVTGTKFHGRRSLHETERNGDSKEIEYGADINRSESRQPKATP